MVIAMERSSRTRRSLEDIETGRFLIDRTVATDRRVLSQQATVLYPEWRMASFSSPEDA
jgi:hypothetical protein